MERFVDAQALHDWTYRLVQRQARRRILRRMWPRCSSPPTCGESLRMARPGCLPTSNWWKQALWDPRGASRRETGKPRLARFDANKRWGHHAARVATDDAIARARDLGAAISLVRNTNHYGIAGWYAMRAAL